MTAHEHPEIPRLVAEPVGDGRQWRVWCKWCRTWHYHAPEPGDRACHCLYGVDSPYEDSGYWLIPAAGDAS